MTPNRIIIDGAEYAYWVHANFPWNKPGYISVNQGLTYDIYRDVNYIETNTHVPVCSSCGATDWECGGCGRSLQEQILVDEEAAAERKEYDERKAI